MGPKLVVLPVSYSAQDIQGEWLFGSISSVFGLLVRSTSPIYSTYTRRTKYKADEIQKRVVSVNNTHREVETLYPHMTLH